jgi:hypothetical protein
MTGKKGIFRYRSYLIVIAFLLMMTLSGISSAKTNFDRSITIGVDKFYEVPVSEVKAGEILNVEMQVTSGYEVDVLLMKPSDYADYQGAIKQKGTFNYIANGSSLRVTSKKYTYTFQEAGDYFLVIDNTELPKGGGPSNEQVEMNLKVKVEAPQTPSTSGSTPSETVLTPSSTPKAPGFQAILSASVIMVLFFRLSKNK